MKDTLNKTRRRNNKGILEIKNLNRYQYGIFSIEKKIIKEKQLDTIKKIIKKIIKTSGNFISTITMNKTITKKPLETRMGNGKGDIIGKYSMIRKNQKLIEINCKNIKIILFIIKKIKYKLNIKIKIIKKHNENY